MNRQHFQFGLATALWLMVAAAVGIWWWKPTHLWAECVARFTPDEESVETVCLDHLRHGPQGIFWETKEPDQRPLDFNFTDGYAGFDPLQHEVLVCEFTCAPYSAPQFHGRASGLLLVASAAPEMEPSPSDGCWPNQTRRATYLIQVPKNARLLVLSQAQAWLLDGVVAVFVMLPLLIPIGKGLKRVVEGSPRTPE